nr:toll/interleukin-1 receptor domain-containing protein [Nostoc sp. EkiNYC01]
MPKKLAYDLFISHASEDKEALVRPLLRALVDEGAWSFWLDEIAIQPSESIRASIDLGIQQSRYVLIVLSKPYFKKHWTGLEFNTAFHLKRKLFPIWHGVNAAEVKRFSSMIADIKGLPSSDGVEQVARSIAQVLDRDPKSFFVASRAHREEKRAFWAGAQLYIGYHVGSVSEETISKLNQMPDTTTGLNFLQHFEKELEVSGTQLQQCRSEFPTLDDEEATLCILEILKEKARETGWCPPTSGLELVVEKLKAASAKAREAEPGAAADGRG